MTGSRTGHAASRATSTNAPTPHQKPIQNFFLNSQVHNSASSLVVDLFFYMRSALSRERALPRGKNRAGGTHGIPHAAKPTQRGQRRDRGGSRLEGQVWQRSRVAIAGARDETKGGETGRGTLAGAGGEPLPDSRLSARAFGRDICVDPLGTQFPRHRLALALGS